MADFDFAVMAGSGFDNYKTVQNIISNPRWGCRYVCKDGGAADIYDLMSTTFRDVPHEKHSARTLLFRTDLFARFLVGKPGIVKRWKISPATVAILDPIQVVESNVKLAWRNGKDRGLGLSGKTTTTAAFFSAHEARKELAKLEDAYLNGMKLSPQHWPLVCQKTIADAAQFINQEAYVPRKWWKWVLVYSLVDHVILPTLDTECWSVWEWSTFWGEQERETISLVHMYMQWSLR